VDKIAALHDSLSIPASFGEDGPGWSGLEGAFDANATFSVLDCLSLEPGYVLDYFWISDTLPRLYARPVDQPPLRTLGANREHVLGRGRADASSGDIESVRDRARFLALQHVRITDTSEGYFQAAVYLVMGPVFYLFGHANYGRRRIVCSPHALPRTFKWACFGDEMTVESQVREVAADLRPTVAMGATLAEVRVVTFASYGGLQEIHLKITRTFPHRVSAWAVKTLLPYRWGIMFWAGCATRFRRQWRAGNRCWRR
jgi:hypothetical protein